MKSEGTRSAKLKEENKALAAEIKTLNERCVCVWVWSLDPEVNGDQSTILLVLLAVETVAF